MALVFLITDGVQRELAAGLARRPDLRAVAELIAKAKDPGVVTPFAAATAGSLTPAFRHGLRDGDGELLEIVNHLRKAEGDRVYLATEDRRLAAAVEGLGGRTIGASQLQNEVQGAAYDSVLETQVRAVRRSLRAYTWFNGAIGVVVTSVSYVACSRGYDSKRP